MGYLIIPGVRDVSKSPGRPSTLEELLAHVAKDDRILEGPCGDVVEEVLPPASGKDVSIHSGSFSWVSLQEKPYYLGYGT